MEMTLGGRIQTLRKQRGITQEELAKAFYPLLSTGILFIMGM